MAHCPAAPSFGAQTPSRGRAASRTSDLVCRVMASLRGRECRAVCGLWHGTPGPWRPAPHRGITGAADRIHAGEHIRRLTADSKASRCGFFGSRWIRPAAWVGCRVPGIYPLLCGEDVRSPRPWHTHPQRIQEKSRFSRTSLLGGRGRPGRPPPPTRAALAADERPSDPGEPTRITRSQWSVNSEAERVASRTGVEVDGRRRILRRSCGGK